MDVPEYLTLRGWGPASTFGNMWCCLRGDRGPLYSEAEAYAEQRARDDHHLEAFGSVLYWPTATQAHTSPLLSALAAAGRTEASAIEHLFRASEEMRAHMNRLAAFQPPAPIHITADEGVKVLAAGMKRAQDVGDAWKALAIARTGAMQAFDSESAACSAAVATLRALGVDPYKP